MEFERITEIKSFITRIEECNRRIRPLLEKEIEIITIELKTLNEELLILKPIFTALVEKNQFYVMQKNQIRNQLLVSKVLDINNFDFEKLHLQFLIRFPEFTEFDKEFKVISEKHKVLTERIQNLNILLENITTYNIKIAAYFGQ